MKQYNSIHIKVVQEFYTMNISSQVTLHKLSYFIHSFLSPPHFIFHLFILTISLPYSKFVSLISNSSHLLVVLVFLHLQNDGTNKNLPYGRLGIILEGEGSFCKGYYGKKREFINKIIL